MICGAEKLGNYFGQSKQSALLSLSRLEKFGYLHCFQRGKGRGIASKYQQGELYSREKRDWIKEQLLANEERAKPLNFERTEPKGKPRGKPPTKGEKVQKSIPFNNAEKVQKSISKRYKNLYPHPIGQPIHTHTKELPSAFTKENWLNRGKEKYPDWDADNMTSAFYSGEMKEGLNGNWPSFQDKCYHLRITSAKTTPAPAPRSWQRQPSKPQEPSCHSPRLKPLDYTDPIILRDSIYYALRGKNGIAGIVAGIDTALVEVALAHAEKRLSDHKNGLSRFDSLPEWEGMTKIKI